MIKKRNFTEYMVDVQGYDLDEAVALWDDYAGCVDDFLSHSEILELEEYIGV